MKVQGATKQAVWLKPEDMPLWDRFVASHPWGSIYHLSSWQSCLERSFPHIKGSVAAIREPHTGRILGGLPVYAVRSWLLGHRMVSVPFGTFSDPLVETDQETLLLTRALLDRCRQTGASSVQLRLWHADSSCLEAEFGISRFYKVHYIPLDRDLPDIRKSFHPDAVCRKLARAEREEIEIRQGSDEQDLQAFCRLSLQQRKRLGLPPIPYRFFKSLWDAFQPPGHFSLYVATHRGTVVGALLGFTFAEQFSAEFLADDTRYRAMGITQALYWEAIKGAHAAGCRVFGFGRTASNNKGLMTYKARWGTRVKDLPTCVFPKSQSQAVGERDTSRSYLTARWIFQKAPTPVCKMLGHFAYKHMG